jgi:predicted RNA-binding protein associated with RNAse of E/G family
VTQPRVIHYHYTRPGKNVDVYDHWLLVDEANLKVLLMEEYAGEPLSIDGNTVAEPGSALLWFVFPDAWHDIGRFHLADDTFTGWYTNLCTPVDIDGDVWQSTDLFLDHWMAPDGRHAWLDEDELADAVAAGLVNGETQARVARERAGIQMQLDLGTWPPAEAMELDLERARGLLKGRPTTD